KALPAVAEAAAFTRKCVAAVWLSSIVLLVPVIEVLAVSVAVMVWLPVLLSVALKLPVPLLRVLLAGNTALPSVLVKCTVPPYAEIGRASCSGSVSVTVEAGTAVAEG